MLSKFGQWVLVGAVALAIYIPLLVGGFAPAIQAFALLNVMIASWWIIFSYIIPPRPEDAGPRMVYVVLPLLDIIMLFARHMPSFMED